MFISNKETLTGEESPIWEESGLQYNYNKENAREKNIIINVDDVIGILTSKSLSY